LYTEGLCFDQRPLLSSKVVEGSLQKDKQQRGTRESLTLFDLYTEELDFDQRHLLSSKVIEGSLQRDQQQRGVGESLT
jgi:hypothetical protein